MMSAAFPFQKQHADVLGHKMAYVDVGEGDPIVLRPCFLYVRRAPPLP